MDININIADVGPSTDIPPWAKELISVIILAYLGSTRLSEADQKSLNELVNILKDTNSKIDSAE